MNVADCTHHFNTGSQEEPRLSRRRFLTAAPAAGLSAMMAGAVPAVALDDAPTDWMAEITRLSEQIVDLLTEALPAGHSVRGFALSCVEGRLTPDSIWATAIPGDCRYLTHCRPGVGVDWFVRHDQRPFDREGTV